MSQNVSQDLHDESVERNLHVRVEFVSSLDSIYAPSNTMGGPAFNTAQPQPLYIPSRSIRRNPDPCDAVLVYPATVRFLPGERAEMKVFKRKIDQVVRELDKKRRESWNPSLSEKIIGLNKELVGPTTISLHNGTLFRVMSNSSSEALPKSHFRVTVRKALIPCSQKSRIVALMLCASVAATAKKESNGMELASTAQSFSCPKLEHLLKRLNMSELLPSFYKERLTLPLLCALGEKDIEEALRDIPFGHRVLLKRIISKARDVQSRNGIDLGGNIWKEADKVAEDIFGDVSGANRLAQKEASGGKSSTPRRLAESSESQLLTSSSSDELFSSRIPIGRLFASSNCYAHIFKSIFSYLAGNSYGHLPGFRLLQRRRVMAFSESNSKGEEGRPVHVARFGPGAPHDAELTISSGTVGGFGGGFGGGRRGPVRPSSWAFKFDAIDSVMICTKSIVREKKGGGSRVPYASCWSFRVTEMNALKQRVAGSRTYYNPGGFSPFGAGPGGRSGVVGARKVFALCGLMTKLPTNLEEFVKVCEGDGEFVAWVLSDSNVLRGPMEYGGGYRRGAPQPTVIGNLGTFKETNPASSSSNFVDAIWLEENDVISFACRNMSKAGPTGPGGEEITVAKLTLGGSTSKAPSEDSQHLNRIDVSVNGVRNGDWTVSNVKHGPMYPFVILLRNGDGLKTTRLRYPRMLD